MSGKSKSSYVRRFKLSPWLTPERNANAAVWNSGVARQKLQFTYDPLGRRIGKQVSNWDSTGGGAWVPETNRKFIYEGWNLIAELNAAAGNALLRTYAWGLDLSGSKQGAGGVGGLVAIREGGNTFLPAYDGNGNVMGMTTAAAVTFTINGNTVSYAAGSLVAAYEYDAFGQTLRETGPYAASNPIRFSTKYTDTETGLLYYGYRYYSPSLGRFINRDPIGEQGGRNQYAFVGNNGVSRVDMLGLYQIQVCFLVTRWECQGWTCRLTTSTSCTWAGPSSEPTPSGSGNDGPAGGESGGQQSGGGGGGGGGGTSDETLILPPVVVTGGYEPPPSIDLGSPTITDVPITPGGVSGTPTFVEPNKTERWPDEKCKGLAAQISDLKSQISTVFDSMAGLNSRYTNATTVAGVSATLGVLTDAAVIFGAGSAAAGAAARGYMQSALGRTLAQEYGTQAAYQVAADSGRAAFWGFSAVFFGDRAKGFLTSADNSIIASGPSLASFGSSVQNFGNGIATTIIENANQASQDMTKALAGLRDQLKPRLADYDEHCK